ncbi:MAG: hypothetical protein WBL63_24335 [Candidatus Acidiferrum sp.]
MRRMAMIALFAATGCLAQEPAPPQSSPAGQEQAPAPEQKLTITVPAGTRVPLKLTYSLWSKTARTGDAVHAVTAFPVTVGTTVAIPAGTYAEGAIDKVAKRASADHPALQMHFTRLLFANGYTVSLEGATTELSAVKPGAVPWTAASSGESVPRDLPPASQSVAGNAFGAQQPPVLTPPPMPGPSIGEVVGIGVGVTVASVVALVLLGRHRGGYTLLDAGSQIEMVLQNPLALDGEQVAAALATPSAQ